MWNDQQPDSHTESAVSSYILRHAMMGGLSMAILVAIGIARNSAPSYLLVLAIAGVAQGVVVCILDRRLRR